MRQGMCQNVYAQLILGFKLQLSKCIELLFNIIGPVMVVVTVTIGDIEFDSRGHPACFIERFI